MNIMLLDIACCAQKLTNCCEVYIIIELLSLCPKGQKVYTSYQSNRASDGSLDSFKGNQEGHIKTTDEALPVFPCL